MSAREAGYTDTPKWVQSAEMAGKIMDKAAIQEKLADPHKNRMVP